MFAREITDEFRRRSVDGDEQARSRWLRQLAEAQLAFPTLMADDGTTQLQVAMTQFGPMLVAFTDLDAAEEWIEERGQMCPPGRPQPGMFDVALDTADRVAAPVLATLPFGLLVDPESEPVLVSAAEASRIAGVQLADAKVELLGPSDPEFAVPLADALGGADDAPSHLAFGRVSQAGMERELVAFDPAGQEVSQVGDVVSQALHGLGASALVVAVTTLPDGADLRRVRVRR